MFNVTVTYDSGNATSITAPSMRAASEIAEEYYNQLGCRKVIIKEERSDRAWEYVGERVISEYSNENRKAKVMSLRDGSYTMKGYKESCTLHQDLAENFVMGEFNSPGTSAQKED